ncbi:MAG: primosomal protein N' [Alphaproteobacteria bacterium]|nr:primosomal protein N' [Alphaproteobacteria bacterium]
MTDQHSEPQPILPSPDIAEVLIPLPVSHNFDYLIPASLSVKEGDIVSIPFGKRHVIGVVWKKTNKLCTQNNIKHITNILDIPSLPFVSREFIDWVASYTLSPRGSVLRMALSIHRYLNKPSPQKLGWRAVPNLDLSTLNTKQQKVMQYLSAGEIKTTQFLCDAASVSSSVIKTMARKGFIHPSPLPTQKEDRDFYPPDLPKAHLSFNHDQNKAIADLYSKMDDLQFHVVVLDGVTGSGKTEVYFETIAKNFTAGKQTLILLPEIALTAQWLNRFNHRFGFHPTLWHSHLTPKERKENWHKIISGHAKIIVGARSALFLGYPNLGLIIVDEEHDLSYKQEEGVIYHARDMAIVRARFGQITIILVSATPSLETLANLYRHRYHLVHLPERPGTASLPTVHLVDLRTEQLPTAHWISNPLRKALTVTFEKKEQAMLFLNRRGYAPLTLCRTCGYRIQCPECTSWLVHHKNSAYLKCHHCNYQILHPHKCPECQSEHTWIACGPGVERIAEEINGLFPNIHTKIITSDTLPNPQAIADIIQKIENKEIDLIIGTQIMAKGHHFPNLTLVGVIDGDLGLQGGDLRASERTWQMLHQVAGRAGRADKPGQVIIQTYNPHHPVMQALLKHDKEAFMNYEFHEREQSHMPPFGKLASVIITSRNEHKANELAYQLSHSIPKIDYIVFLGPSAAPLARLKGWYRQRFLIKCDKSIYLQPILNSWIHTVKLDHQSKIHVDIDPYHFF